jgi:hypothetical protein
MSNNYNNIPNVNDVVNSWSIPMTAYRIKKVMKDGVMSETKTSINFKGVPLQPIPTRQLLMKPEGERDWKYFNLYCDYNFKMDDVIILDGREFRIKGKKDDNVGGIYGYCKYELIEGYQDE